MSPIERWLPFPHARVTHHVWWINHKFKHRYKIQSDNKKEKNKNNNNKCTNLILIFIVAWSARGSRRHHCAHRIRPREATDAAWSTSGSYGRIPSPPSPLLMLREGTVAAVACSGGGRHCCSRWGRAPPPSLAEGLCGAARSGREGEWIYG